MENVLEFNRGLELNNDLSFIENRNKGQFVNVVNKVLDSGVSYAIKALPINENVKDVLIDVKNAFKTKDFKTILKTVVNSSIREGLEILSLPKTTLEDILKVSKVAFKGGLSAGIGAGIDIISNKYLKNNIFASTINTVLKDLKNYVFSKDFKEKLDLQLNKLFEKKDQFNTFCNKWYDSYEKLDILGMNKICRSIKNIQPNVVNDKDCLKQTKIIENMTQLVNNKQGKLTPMQMEVCNIV